MGRQADSYQWMNRTEDQGGMEAGGRPGPRHPSLKETRSSPGCSIPNNWDPASWVPHWAAGGAGTVDTCMQSRGHGLSPCPYL